MEMLDVYLPLHYAYWLFYGSTLALIVVSVLGFTECWRALGGADRDVLLAKEYGTREMICAAEIRRELVWWFTFGFLILLVGSAVAASAMLYLPPPPPDRSLSTGIVRICTVLAIVCFWQGKLVSRAMRETFERTT